jgi:carbamoyl-phosphate synthase large subunit
MKRILCTGAGGPAGINFVMSLRLAPEKMFIVGTEASEHYLNLATTQKKFRVPRAIEPNYVDTLNEIIRKEKVEFLHAQPDVHHGVAGFQQPNQHADFAGCLQF